MHVCVCVCVCVGRGCAYNMPGMSAIILKLPAHRGLLWTYLKQAYTLTAFIDA